MNRLILPSSSTSSPLRRLSRLLSSQVYRDARFFILLDENTYTHCLTRLVAEVEPLQEAEFLEVPVGEECKDMAIATQLWQTLLESGADRQSVLVNLGGGAVSDLGGFVAAAYQRGIRCINVPTTLVGMVDAAIGGKTALNLDGSKNQVGFFHQPEAVCVCPDFLQTLPRQELVSGLFEMLKTLLIADEGLYLSLADDILRQEPIVQPNLLAACARIKQAVVRRDPYDRSVRHILNLGHTFGHAIEAYSHLSHGVAVGWGMACALYLSVRKLGFPQHHYDYYRQVVAKLVDPIHYNLADTEGILSLMRHDKKNVGGNICCVLLQDLGLPVIDVEVPELEIRDALLHL